MSHKSKRLVQVPARERTGPLARNRATTAQAFLDERRRRAKDVALAADMRRVLELFHEAPGGMIVTVGSDHLIQLINAAYSQWIGGREVIGLPLGQAFPNLPGSGFYRLMDEVYASGEAQVVRGARSLVQAADGSEREAWVNFVLQPLKDEHGGVCGVFCQGHEVTNEKHAVDRLEASQAELQVALEQFQTIVESSYDLICTIDAAGAFTQINGRAETLLGYTAQQMLGRPFTDFVHPDDVAESEAAARRVAQGEATNAFINRYLHRDGEVVTLMWSSVWSESRQVLYCIGRDLREHAAAEETLRQAQKMEAIGRLTGGVAHDFNNLLTAVIGSAEALSEALEDRPDLQALAEVAMDAATRGAELVRQLLTLSRNQPLEPKPIDCAAFLEDLSPILKRTIGQQIDVTIEAEAGVHCLADRSQLTAAVLNLAVNARDAMPDGGLLRLRAAREGVETVSVWVADTGEGMSDAVRQRALEPFFTTKPQGQGSGLGLAMVHGFVSQSGGRLEIESEEGAGTMVRLLLPAADAAVCAPTRADPVAGGLEPDLHVFLVEDDELVRGQVERQLAALGCRVTAFGDPYEALDGLAGETSPDLLMTDIAMPGGMNGRQLADHARLLRPRLPVLFTSGHTEDKILRGAGQRAVGAFLPKPYRRAELARKLAEALQEAR